MRSSLFVSCIIVLGLISAFVGAARADCSAASTCDACTTTDSCVWCASAVRCVPVAALSDAEHPVLCLDRVESPSTCPVYSSISGASLSESGGRLLLTFAAPTNVLGDASDCAAVFDAATLNRIVGTRGGAASCSWKSTTLLSVALPVGTLLSVGDSITVRSELTGSDGLPLVSSTATVSSPFGTSSFVVRSAHVQVGTCDAEVTLVPRVDGQSRFTYSWSLVSTTVPDDIATQIRNTIAVANAANILNLQLAFGGLGDTAFGTYVLELGATSNLGATSTGRFQVDYLNLQLPSVTLNGVPDLLPATADLVASASVTHQCSDVSSTATSATTTTFRWFVFPTDEPTAPVPLAHSTLSSLTLSAGTLIPTTTGGYSIVVEVCLRGANCSNTTATVVIEPVDLIVALEPQNTQLSLAAGAFPSVTFNSAGPTLTRDPNDPTATLTRSWSCALVPTPASPSTTCPFALNRHFTTATTATLTVPTLEFLGLGGRTVLVTVHVASPRTGLSGSATSRVALVNELVVLAHPITLRFSAGATSDPSRRRPTAIGDGSGVTQLVPVVNTNAGETTYLEATYSLPVGVSPASANPRFQWTLETRVSGAASVAWSSVSLADAFLAPAGSTAIVLALRSNLLTVGNVYRATVSVRLGSLIAASTSSIVFFCNGQPTGGSLSISPGTGAAGLTYAVLTPVTLTAADWASADGGDTDGLQYSFGTLLVVSGESGVQTQALTPFTADRQATLPSLPYSATYVQPFVSVRDRYGAVVVLRLSSAVTVTLPDPSATADLDTFITDSLDTAAQLPAAARLRSLATLIDIVRATVPASDLANSTHVATVGPIVTAIAATAESLVSAAASDLPDEVVATLGNAFHSLARLPALADSSQPQIAAALANVLAAATTVSTRSAQDFSNLLGHLATLSFLLTPPNDRSSPFVILTDLDQSFAASVRTQRSRLRAAAHSLGDAIARSVPIGSTVAVTSLASSTHIQVTRLPLNTAFSATPFPATGSSSIFVPAGFFSDPASVLPAATASLSFRLVAFTRLSNVFGPSHADGLELRIVPQDIYGNDLPEVFGYEQPDSALKATLTFTLPAGTLLDAYTYPTCFYYDLDGSHLALGIETTVTTASALTIACRAPHFSAYSVDVITRKPNEKPVGILVVAIALTSVFAVVAVVLGTRYVKVKRARAAKKRSAAAGAVFPQEESGADPSADPNAPENTV